MDSIVQSEKECYLCGRKVFLEVHHMMDGPNRKASERYGLKVWLCRSCHTGTHGVHNNRELDLMLRQVAQRVFERTHSKEEWMKVFGRNYIEED